MPEKVSWICTSQGVAVDSGTAVAAWSRQCAWGELSVGRVLVSRVRNAYADL
jgi:hypothetical protein